MANQKRKKSFFTWMFILGGFAVRDTLADLHSHDFHFTAIGSATSLLDFIVISSVDDVQLCYYNKQDQQVVMKQAWMYEALGATEIEQKQKKLISLEKSFQWAFKNLINETENEKTHTLQVFVDCELDKDVQVSSHFQFALDGEDFCQMDKHLGHWVAMKPEAQRFKPLWDSALWNRLVKHYLQEDCINSMTKVLQYSSMREKVPPEVTVSRHDAPDDGRVTLFCRATGFYPRSITLHWERDGALGVWGQESSSGTLPNADATFYLQVTLELPPSDPGTGYTCVVEHSELETPAVFPVPGKPSMERLWTIILSTAAIIILVVSCAGAFIIWKKRKTGINSQLEGSFLSCPAIPLQ